MERAAWEYGFTHLWELLDLIRSRPLSDGMIIPLFIWGEAGTGKTTMVRQYCELRGIGRQEHLVAQDSKGSDIAGQPIVSEVPIDEFYAERGEDVPEGVDPESTVPQTDFALPKWLPVAERDGDKGILFLDEFNRTDPDVLNAYMELVGSGSITQSGYKIPPGWIIVAAANPTTSGFNTKPLDSAMVDRFLHYAPGTQMANWAKWAKESDMNPTVVDFVLGNQNDVIKVSDPEFSPDVKVEATLRSTERFSSLYSPDLEDRLVDAIGNGLLGYEATERFIEFRRKEETVITPTEILSGRIDKDRDEDVEYTKDMIGVLEKKKRRDLIRASTERAVASLIDNEAPLGRKPDNPTEAKVFEVRKMMAVNMYEWIYAMPDINMSGEALASLREAAPKWMTAMAIVDKMNNGKLTDKLGNNIASVRRPSTRERKSERRQLKVDDYQTQDVFSTGDEVDWSDFEDDN